MCVLKRVLVKGFILYYFVFMNISCLVTNISDLGWGFVQNLIQSITEYMIQGGSRIQDDSKFRMLHNGKDVSE